MLCRAAHWCGVSCSPRSVIEHYCELSAEMEHLTEQLQVGVLRVQPQWSGHAAVAAPEQCLMSLKAPLGHASSAHTGLLGCVWPLMNGSTHNTKGIRGQQCAVH